jgi:predicted RNA-binding protein with PIN domain
MKSQSLRILIDGYNLLFQSQLVGRGRAAGWLERARGRLLNLLIAGLSKRELARTEIVFDAAARGPTPDDQVLPSGLVVTFARNHAEADDLIEERIRQHSHPKSLRVISADNRIIKRAKTRRAVVLDPETFLEELESAAVSDSRPVSNPHQAEPIAGLAGSELLSDKQVEYWLEEFDLGSESD